MAPLKEKFTTKNISKWSEYIIGLITNSKPLQGPGILVSKKPNGYLIETDRAAGAGGAGTYSGPFAVIKKNDTTITIKAYDGVDYLGRNRIVAGLESAIVSADTDVTITTSGPVYVKITYSSGIVYNFYNAASLPGQVNGEVYKTIAEVLFVGGKITQRTQVQRDEIHVAGRVT